MKFSLMSNCVRYWKNNKFGLMLVWHHCWFGIMYIRNYAYSEVSQDDVAS